MQDLWIPVTGLLMQVLKQVESRQTEDFRASFLRRNNELFFFGGGVAVIVTQLVERLLPIPEVLVSNPDIGKIYIEHEYTFS